MAGSFALTHVESVLDKHGLRSESKLHVFHTAVSGGQIDRAMFELEQGWSLHTGRVLLLPDVM